MNPWAILLAAGKSSRLAAHGHATPKQFLLLDDAPVFWRSAVTLSRLAPLRGIVFVMPPEGDFSHYEALIQGLEADLPGKRLNLPWKIALGGPLRQDSVHNGLQTLPPDCRAVLVHDSARPFASAALCLRVLEPVLAGRPAVIPGIPVSDTIKAVTSSASVPSGFQAGPDEASPAQNASRSESVWVAQTYDRSLLRAVQTPQGFLLTPLRDAHARAAREGWEVTDDAALLERAGQPVLVVEGEEGNRKITTPADLALLGPREEAPMSGRIPCTGFGYDVHRYGGSRPFILGGVPILCDVTLTAHSDGDVLLHALMDALLGCVGGGDIGGLFPDSDPVYENISSGLLLAEVLERCQRLGLEVSHVDLTVIAQVPRIAPHRQNIAANVAKLLHLPPSRVNVKATTEEHLGFTGEKKGIKAVALVTGTVQG